MVNEQDAPQGETPADRMTRYVKRWMRSAKAAPVLARLLEELRTPKASYHPDSPLMRSFVGMVTAWSVKAHELQKGPEGGNSTGL